MFTGEKWAAWQKDTTDLLYVHSKYIVQQTRTGMDAIYSWAGSKSAREDATYITSSLFGLRSYSDIDRKHTPITGSLEAIGTFL